MKPLLYLASPYTAKTPGGVLDVNTMSIRASLVAVAAARIIDMGTYYVYSPVIHNHIVNQYLRTTQPAWDFWGPVDMHFLRFSDVLGVLMLDGWRESHGLQEEIGFARHVDMPTVWVSMSENSIVRLVNCPPMFETAP